MPLFGPPNVGKLRARRDVAGLVKALSYDRWVVIRDAIEALGELGDTAAVEPLVSIVADKDGAARAVAVTALGRLGDARAIETLIAAVTDEDWTVRRAARDALQQQGSLAVEPLLGLLAGSDDHGRIDAAELLGKLGDARAVDALVTALEDNNEDATVRSAAAGALHQFASLPERALEPLASHDRQEAERHRQVVETATRTVIQALLDGKRKTAEWLDRHYDDYAPGDIGPLGEEYSRLMERHREESDAVVSRLRRLGDSEAVVGILRATFEEGDSDERWAVSRVAEELGISELAYRVEDEPVEVGALIDVLRSDQSIGVRLKAAEALGETGDARAVEPLIEVIKSGEEHPGFLMRVATALGHLGDPAAIEVLQPLTESGFDLVQKAANDALQELAGGRRRPTRPDHLEGAERERALAQKAEYRQRAVEWWSQTDRAGAICDDCNTTIPRPEGFLRPGHLACEKCTDKMVSGYYS